MNNQQTFFVFVAMPVEEDAVRSVLSAAGGELSSDATGWEFEIAGHRPFLIVLVRVGQGITQALNAIKGQLAARPCRAAFFVGTAGGVKDVELMDVVVASSIVYPGPEKHSSDGPRYDFSLINSDTSLVEAATAISTAEWSKYLPSDISERPRREAQSGQILSSNVLFEDATSPIMVTARSAFRGLLAVEMEGYALLLASKDAESPVPSLVLRGISDLISNHAAFENDRRQKVASSFAAALAFSLVRRLTSYDNDGSTALGAVVLRMTKRSSSRTEADLQADVRQTLLHGELRLNEDHLNVSLETPIGGGRRIDVEAGYTVIECKKDLRTTGVKSKAIDQLAGYMNARETESGREYNGVLTDGVDWHLFMLRDGQAEEISHFAVDPSAPDVEGLKVWLEGVLATQTEIPPTPVEIQNRLGAASPSYALAKSQLSALYERCSRDPEVGVKRMLWARLLTTAFGSAFEDGDSLFIEHTYLVIVAELIAHEVVGLDVRDESVAVADLLSGEYFSRSGITGVVENDFFDWVVLAPGGERFVREMTRRIARFAWSGDIEHDVLKFLYESVVSSEERHSLGEYYTPDWLAEAIVDEIVTEPLKQRVFDPACGSGTFLFAAVRNVLRAADAAGMPNDEAVELVVNKVYGSDVHPVAVTLARVTYLLAIGLDRLHGDRGTIRIPVSVGDSLQWNQADADLFTGGDLVVRTLDGEELFASELRWPYSVAAGDQKFDELVTELADKATARERGKKPLGIAAILNRYGLLGDDRITVDQTYLTMCRLHDERRNHIWGYYVRNLARPFWLSLPENRPDVLVGNPPWLSYRYMTADMKERFRDDARARNLWAGSAVATSQDLSAYFVARTAELYLKEGGQFGFVMPLAALTRPHFEGFRKGLLDAPTQENRIAFDKPWDIRGVRPHVFPMPASVVYGTKAPYPKALEAIAETWSGLLPNNGHANWDTSKAALSSSDSVVVRPSGVMASPYGSSFKQGATIVPRTLLTVRTLAPSHLGQVRGIKRIQSLLSSDDKAPWKFLEAREGEVEERFIFPLHYGKTLAPFRTLTPLQTAIPWDGDQMLEAGSENLESFPKFAKWWGDADRLWRENGKNKMTLTERADYQRTLSNQFPPAPHRVVYNRSGTRLTAAYIPEPNAIIDTKLYWGTVRSRAEADYLCAVLNSRAMTDLVNPVQSTGNFGPRDFYGLPFEFPIPLFDGTLKVHALLSQLGADAAIVAQDVKMKDNVTFQAARKAINAALDAVGLSETADSLVKELLIY